MFTFFWQVHRSTQSPTWKHSNALFVLFLFFFLSFFFLLLVIISLQKLHLLTAGSASIQSTLLREHKLHSASSRSQTGPMCASGEAGSIDGRNTAVGSSVTQTPRRRGSQRGQNKSSHSPAHSSDSTHSQHKHTHRGRNSRHQRKWALAYFTFSGSYHCWIALL